MSQMHNPFAGETPFPAAGEGVVIKFTTTDIARLHSLYGPDLRKAPEMDPQTNRVNQTFWTTIIGWISVHDPVVIQNVLRVGLKEFGPDGKLRYVKRDDEWWDDPPFSYSDVAEVVEHGLIWSRWGTTAEQLAAQLEAEATRVHEGGEPADPQNRTTASPTSSGLSSGPTSKGSRQKKRGR
jgi:hypothetical protein